MGPLDHSNQLEVIRGKNRISIGPAGGPIRLTIDGQHQLNLIVTYLLSLSTHGKYLAVEKSEFKVFPVIEAAPHSYGPLVRFDFIRAPHSKDVPTAHLNINSNNGSFPPILERSGLTRRTKNRRKKAEQQSEKPPESHSIHGSESDVHIPVGGARFRPCLEDVLEMLIVEFGVDHSAGNWRETLAKGRKRWREHQLAAAVNDNPTTAANQLRELGYAVEWNSEDHPPRPRDAKLGRF